MTKKFVQIYLAQGLQDLFMKYVIMIQLWGPHGQILSINTQKVSHCIVFCYFYLLQSTKWLKSWFRDTLGHSEQDLLMAFVVVNTFWGPQRPILSIPTKKSVIFDSFSAIVALAMYQMTWKLVQTYLSTWSTSCINDICHFEVIVGQHRPM